MAGETADPFDVFGLPQPEGERPLPVPPIPPGTAPAAGGAPGTPLLKALTPPAAAPGATLGGIGGRLGSAFADAAAGATTPFLGRGLGWSPQIIPGKSPASTEEAGEEARRILGVPHYQPTSELDKMGQSGLSSAILGLVDPKTIPGMFFGGAGSEYGQHIMPNNPILGGLLGFIGGAKGGTWLGNRFLPAGGGVRPDPGSPSTQLGDEANFPPNRGGLMPYEDAALADRARELGIRLDPYQVSNSPALKYTYSATSKMPFSGAAGAREDQFGQVGRALTQMFGENSERLTPEVFTAARGRLGGVFDYVGQNLVMPVLQRVAGGWRINDQDFVNGLRRVITNAEMGGVSDDLMPRIRNMAATIMRSAANNNGSIGGSAYLDMTGHQGPIAAMIGNGRGALSDVGRQFRAVIDDAMDRWATRSGNPEMAEGLADARRQWRNMIIAEDLPKRGDTVGGATPSTGVVSPAALSAAVIKNYGNQVARLPLGQVPIWDLAKVGQRFLKEPPESGTTPRAMVAKGMEHAGDILGGGLGLGLAGSGSWKELAALIGTTMAGRAAQETMRMPGFVNRPVRAALNPEGFQFKMPWMLGAAANSPSGMWLPGQQGPQ